MSKSIILYLIAVLVVLDCVLCTGVVLQLVCLVLVGFCCAGGYYIHRKQSTGIWLNNKQYDELHEFVKEQILLDARKK